uniref:Uncharacterized protein n=1 Tax=Parascaris univalens TaxID=6257 RepID=A0A915A7U4_PARUN
MDGATRKSLQREANTPNKGVAKMIYGQVAYRTFFAILREFLQCFQMNWSKLNCTIYPITSIKIMIICLKNHREISKN